MPAFDATRRRFYVDYTAHVPIIQSVRPGEPNFELGCLELDFAKLQIHDLMTSRIANLRTALKSVHQLTARDIDRQENPSPWPPRRSDAP